MDRANRVFWSLMTLSLGAYGMLALAACGVAALAVERMATGGLAGIVSPGEDLRVPLLLAGVAVLTVTLAVGSVHRQLVATERLARHVRRHQGSPPPQIAAAAAALRLAGRIDVVDTDDRFSFTYGFLRPRVALSRGLIQAATPEEIRAIVEHEAYHVRNLDPLKLVAARALPTALFFLPVLQQLRGRYLLARELAADRRAEARCGTKPLAGALMKALGWPAGFEPAAGAALGGTALLPARVDRLETGEDPDEAPLSLRTVAASAVGVIGLVGAALLTQLHAPVAHAHSAPIGATSSPAAVAATALCSAVWVWLGWRIVSWMRVRPRRHPA